MRYNEAGAERIAKALQASFRKMSKDYTREIMAVIERTPDTGMDAAPRRSLQQTFNFLDDKWDRFWVTESLDFASQTVTKVNKEAVVDVNRSFERIMGGVEIKVADITENTANIITESTNEFSELIRKSTTSYQDKVAELVRKSILEAEGSEGLEAKIYGLLTDEAKKIHRKAHTLALDQTRKVYTNLTTTRMKDVGVKRFEWRHSGGGQHPRRLHQKLNGQIFSFDDPPYIGDMYGQPVYGLPADLPNCKCFYRPVVEFDENGNLI